MQTLSFRKLLICQKFLKFRASADFVRLDTMLGDLLLWREDLGNFAVSPFADIVVLGLHAMNPALDLVSVILNQEDRAIQVLSDDG